MVKRDIYILYNIPESKEAVEEAKRLIDRRGYYYALELILEECDYSKWANLCALKSKAVNKALLEEENECYMLFDTILSLYEQDERAGLFSDEYGKEIRDLVNSASTEVVMRLIRK